MSQLFDCRDAFAAALEDLAAGDPRIVALANDSIGSSKLGGLAKRFPQRVINIGIAEQDLVGMASGLANGGKIPFACSAACFLTGRALEQIKVDLAYTQANVKIVRHEQRRRLRRAGANASCHRRPGLDTGRRRPDDYRPCRPH